jgi:Kef-type K+ transport system membrane component KefB
VTAFPLRRTVALVLVLLVALLVRRSGADVELRSTAFALGFALIAAALAGVLIERLQMPRVTGYLLFGMACGPYLTNIISRPMARELQLFNGLAVVLIAFIAGLEINVARLRPRLLGMLRVGGTNILLTNVGFFCLFWLAWPWLPILPSASGLVRVSLAVLSAVVVSCSSPSVAMAVIAETRSAGTLSELVVAVVILADLALMLLFTLAMQAVRAALGATGSAEVALFARLSWQLFGSFAFGAALGAVFALYLKFVGREVAIVLVALCVLVSQVGSHLHFEPILAGLAAGLVVENIAAPDGDALRIGVEQSALPILIVFFVAAGASLQLDALAQIGAIAAVISIARMVFMRTGTMIGARVSDIGPPVDGLIWMGLVAQAGVTLGLVTLVAVEFPDWGARLQTLVVALIALHQLVGPVLFRTALVRAGEAGRSEKSAASGELSAHQPAG